MNETDSLTAALADLDTLESTGLAAFRKRGERRRGRVGPDRVPGPKTRTSEVGPGAAQDARWSGQASLWPAVQRRQARVGRRRGKRRRHGSNGRFLKPLTRSTSRCRAVASSSAISHPLTQTADELIDIFGRFGFAVARGPEVEDVHHNFDALNIPPSHPARDPLDNFYLSSDTMLRSQTSTVQIRVMESQPPPVRVIAIGRVYRPDTVDATHSFMFHQIEGLMVDTRRDDGRPEDGASGSSPQAISAKTSRSGSGRRSSRSRSRASRSTCSGTAATAGLKWGERGWSIRTSSGPWDTTPKR